MIPSVSTDGRHSVLPHCRHEKVERVDDSKKWRENSSRPTHPLAPSRHLNGKEFSKGPPTTMVIIDDGDVLRPKCQQL